MALRVCLIIPIHDSLSHFCRSAGHLEAGAVLVHRQAIPVLNKADYPQDLRTFERVM